MKRLLPTRLSRFSGTVVLLCLLEAMSMNAQAAANRLVSVETAALGHGRASITLTLDDVAPRPELSLHQADSQLVIALPRTTPDTDWRQRTIDVGPIASLSLQPKNDTAQLVVQMDQAVTYAVSRDEKTIRILVDGTDEQADATASLQSSRVTHIDFRRDAEGAGKLIVTTNGPGHPAVVERQDDQVVATLPDTQLPDKLEKRLVVSDFDTPARYVDAFAEDNATRFVVTANQGVHYKQMAYRSGNKFILELAPIVQPDPENTADAADQPTFTGQKISLSFQHVDVRAVLQIIADTAGINMVVDDAVSGQTTLQLDNVPWDQALNIILQTQGLGMRHIGNVISIAPLDKITKRRKAQEAADAASRSAAPLQSRIIQINYAGAEGLAKLIQRGKDKNAMLSERGHVTVDTRTNSLLITDTQPKLEAIEHVIAKLDIPVRQVQIEARIVVANRSFTRNLGVMQQVGKAANMQPLNDTGYTIGLPISGNKTGGALTTSILAGSFALNLTLEAMETENLGEIISSPRIITTDGQEAVIKQGKEIPYTTSQGNNNPATTEFKDVVLSLTVTPHITPNNHVLLDMNLTQDSVDPQSDINDEPAIDTRSVKTQVLVDDGNTVVLGGIYQHRKNNTDNKVPVLGDIPLLGSLFKGSSKHHEKLELLVFITPKVLQETLTGG